jgi:chemotaxis response regulator CheB
MFQKDGTLFGVDELAAKIRSVSRLLKPAQEGHAPHRLPEGEGRVTPLLVAVGVSTGGPATLVQLLNGFSTALPIAVVIVQHIDARFSRRLVAWLNELVAWPVLAAEEGERPKRGQAYLAVEEAHLVIDHRGCFRYREEPRETPYRPSVDEFFFSLAVSQVHPGYGVLLTGMGSDGAKGLLALKKARWTTYAQDEESSVIYGMPRAAAQLGAADYIQALADIPKSISAEISLD